MHGSGGTTNSLVCRLHSSSPLLLQNSPSILTPRAETPGHLESDLAAQQQGQYVRPSSLMCRGAVTGVLNSEEISTHFHLHLNPVKITFKTLMLQPCEDSEDSAKRIATPHSNRTGAECPRSVTEGR